MRARRLVPFLLPLLLVLPGCAAGIVAAGAAGGFAAAKHVRNQQVRAYRSSLRQAYDATLVVLPELGYPVTGRPTLGPTEANVQAGDARVALASFPNGTTRVAVSVGTFESADNRRRAALILERLDTRLAPAPARP